MPSDSEASNSNGNHGDLVEVHSVDTFLDISDDLKALLRATITRIELELVERQNRLQQARDAYESSKSIQQALKLLMEESAETEASNSADQPSTSDRQAVEKGIAKARRTRLAKIARSLGIIIVPANPSQNGPGETQAPSAQPSATQVAQPSASETCQQPTTSVAKPGEAKVEATVHKRFQPTPESLKERAETMAQLIKENEEREAEEKRKKAETGANSSKSTTNSTSNSDLSVKTAKPTFGRQTPTLSSASNTSIQSSMSKRDPSNIAFPRRTPTPPRKEMNFDVFRDSIFMNRAMIRETERLLSTMRSRKLVKSDGFINDEHFRDELQKFIYGAIKEQMSYFGETEQIPARPFMTVHGEQFDIHFYPANAYENKVIKEHQLNGCSWCYGRNKEFHHTTKCECLHDHQKRLILLLGWRCWGCLEAGHMIDYCPRFAGLACKSCKGPNPSKDHSAWTHFHAHAIMTTLNIQSQEEAIFRCKVLRLAIC